MKRISKKIKTFWGISEVGFSIMSTMETTFLVFFLTDIAQLPLSITAIITGMSAIADAISAVLAGIVIDKVNFKVGKYRQWLLYCPPFVTLFFIFCFTKIGGNTTAGIIIGLAYVLSHFIWNIAWTANRNLIPILTDDPEERSFLSSRIAMGSSLGKIIASYFVPFLGTAFLGIMSGVTAYTVIAGIACLLFLICYYIHYAITDGYDTEIVTNKKAVSFVDMGKSIVSNPHLIAILLHDALRLVAYYGIAATASYYAKVVLEDSSVMSWLLIMFYAGSVIGSYFSNTVSKKLGTKKTSFLGCLSCAILLGVCYFLPSNTIIIAIILFLAQLSFGIAYGLTSNLYAMCGTYSEWKTGENTRGVVMSFCSLAIKLGIAIRGVLISAVLGWIAYDPNMTVITSQAKSGIKLLFIVVFTIIMLISLIPLAFFKLDDKKVIEMEKEISERKLAH